MHRFFPISVLCLGLSLGLTCAACNPSSNDANKPGSHAPSPNGSTVVPEVPATGGGQSTSQPPEGPPVVDSPPVTGPPGTTPIDPVPAVTSEPPPERPSVMAGMGLVIGEVTPTSALAQIRLTSSDQLENGDVPGLGGHVQFVLRAEADPNGVGLSVAVQAVPERDFIARATFTGLLPGTSYSVSTQMGASAASMTAGPQAVFKTLQGPNGTQSVKFAVVTGMAYSKFHGDARHGAHIPPPYVGPDKHLGYPALAAILKVKPDYFVGTGDNVYYDEPTGEWRAQTVPQMRQKWHEQFVQPRFRDLFAAVPTYWEIDDHDYRINDGDNTGDLEPSPQVGRQMMLEQLPLAPADDVNAKTYRTHRVSKDLQVWFVENRMYRTANTMPDGPGKSIWGDEQEAWLKTTLLESDAAFKVLVSPTPMIGPDDGDKIDNHTNIGGFQHERDTFFAWLNLEGLLDRGFFIVCGDRHWQYHSVHPTGVEEFSTGALVGPNARLGRSPGDLASTDPLGKIMQPYSQSEPAAGFLLVQVDSAGNNNPAKLTFTFYSENGAVFYQNTKLAAQ